MFTKTKGECCWTCDDCGTEAYGGTLEFGQAWQDLKRDGWQARKDGDEWQHFCPECAAD